MREEKGLAIIAISGLTHKQLRRIERGACRLTSNAARKLAQVHEMTPNQYTKTCPSSIEVAKLAGVSQSAVSRTFTVGASVSERTRKKVIKAGKALGYSPNILPRILRTNRSRLVAIVTGEMSNPYYTRVLHLWLPRLFSRPHFLGAWSELMYIFPGSHNQRIKYVQEMTEGRGADVVVECAGVPSAFLEGIEMLRQGGTFVEVGMKVVITGE